MCSARTALRRRAEFSLAASATPAPEMDLAGPGRRSRHLDRAGARAHLHRCQPDYHGTAASVAAAAIDRLGRIPARDARARPSAGGGAVACCGRSRGFGFAFGRGATAGGCSGDRHHRRARIRRARCGELPRRPRSWRGSTPAQPGGHDGGAGCDPARLDDAARDESPSPPQPRPQRTRPRQTPTACSPQWACTRSGHLQPAGARRPIRQRWPRPLQHRRSPAPSGQGAIVTRPPAVQSITHPGRRNTTPPPIVLHFPLPRRRSAAEAADVRRGQASSSIGRSSRRMRSSLPADAVWPEASSRCGRRSSPRSIRR